MKQILFAGLAGIVMFSVAGCSGKQNTENQGTDSIEVTVADTALYGTVGEGTSMHSLEVMDENGKTATYLMIGEPDETMGALSASDVQGGVFNGDRITFTTCKNASGEKQVSKLINLTTLCGKWSSLDRNFEIKEDGSVESRQAGETHPYTQWSMVNCNIVFNVDTFAIDYLGPDSLTLENKKGIFVYKRIK